MSCLCDLFGPAFGKQATGASPARWRRLRAARRKIHIPGADRVGRILRRAGEEDVASGGRVVMVTPAGDKPVSTNFPNPGKFSCAALAVLLQAIQLHAAIPH